MDLYSQFCCRRTSSNSHQPTDTKTQQGRHRATCREPNRNDLDRDGSFRSGLSKETAPSHCKLHLSMLRCCDVAMLPPDDVCRRNSLLPEKDSLFPKILSLLICVGNCSRSGCSTAVSRIEFGSQSPRIAKFPVKFPVSREFAWRRVRTALRRQPGSSVSTGQIDPV